jgi:ATP-dependent HslUV protease ATP-binding subunit HslU
MKVRDAQKLLVDEEAGKLINEEEIRTRRWPMRAERHRVHRRDRQGRRRQDAVGADVSREGVQRDLLPLVEGCTVSTKYGIHERPTTSCSSPRARST